LGIKLLWEHSAPHQVRCNSTGQCSEIPNVSYRRPLCATLKDDTTNRKRIEKMKKQANASAKSKELQPNAQADIFAAHLLLPNRTLKNIDR